MSNFPEVRPGDRVRILFKDSGSVDYDTVLSVDEAAIETEAYYLPSSNSNQYHVSIINNIQEDPVDAPTETRVTSSTGGQKGDKLAKLGLVPMDALWELAEQYGKGLEKYPTDDGLDNWRHGYSWSLSFNAAFRHMMQAANGEDIDEETGSKHVVAAAWHMLTLAHFMNRDDLTEFDDRQSVILKKYLEEKEND